MVKKDYLILNLSFPPHHTQCQPLTTTSTISAPPISSRSRETHLLFTYYLAGYSYSTLPLRSTSPSLCQPSILPLPHLSVPSSHQHQLASRLPPHAFSSPRWVCKSILKAAISAKPTAIRCVSPIPSNPAATMMIPLDQPVPPFTTS